MRLIIFSFKSGGWRCWKDTCRLFLNLYKLKETGSMIKIHREHEEPLVLDVLTLKQAHFEGISFHRCRLNDLDFSGSVLVDVDFRSAGMNYVKFTDALFDKSKLIMVESQDACYDACSFRDTLLLYSDFSGSSFRDADLSGGIIKKVIFKNCDLRGTNLSCEGLETCNFEGAVYDDSTVWHEAYNAAQNGALNVQAID